MARMQSSRRVSWGILGTGNIAGTFARNLPKSASGVCHAVASRDLSKARDFAQRHDIAHAYGSYAELLAHPEIEIVYISLPNHLHAHWSIEAMRAGKHVLCEKPCAMDRAETEDILAVASEQKRFFMEAFMYRCQPYLPRLRQLIQEEHIGTIQTVTSSFSFNNSWWQEGNVRQFRTMGGGALMDVGCYPLSLVRLIAGAMDGQPFANPQSLYGVGKTDPASGVDMAASACLRFENSLLATLNCGFRATMDGSTCIYGSKGRIEIPQPWFAPPGKAELHLWKEGQAQPEIIPCPAERTLYATEADECARCLTEGLLESPAMPWQDTLGNMTALDTWRAAIGLNWN